MAEFALVNSFIGQILADIFILNLVWPDLWLYQATFTSCNVFEVNLTFFFARFYQQLKNIFA